MSRHRIRRLDDGRYVCSRRYCDFSDTDLSIAMKHINMKPAVAPKQEPTTNAEAA